MPKPTRTHPRTHTTTNTQRRTRSPPVCCFDVHIDVHTQALCGCESLSVALVLSLHARGLVNYLPKRTQSSGGKGGEGDVPVFEGTWSLQHSVE